VGPPSEIGVDDADDPRLAPYRRLTDRALRNGSFGADEPVAPDAPHGRFLAEGHYVLERLVAVGAPVLSVLLTERRVEAARSYLAGYAGPRYVVSEAMASQVAGFPVHRGVLAVVARPAPLSIAELADGAALLVYLDALTDTENVGAIFRSASALGVDGVIVGPGTADPLYRRCVRVSSGASAVLKWVSDQHGDALARLGASGWRRVGLSPEGPTTLEDLAQRPAQPTVLIVGSEGPGLGEQGRSGCDELVSIPIADGSDSLNVAATAAIALYRLSMRKLE
jgi:tRNA G18 (ribose-2'-O)-methylase SpoU